MKAENKHSDTAIQHNQQVPSVLRAKQQSGVKSTVQGRGIVRNRRISPRKRRTLASEASFHQLEERNSEWVNTGLGEAEVVEPRRVGLGDGWTTPRSLSISPVEVSRSWDRQVTRLYRIRRFEERLRYQGRSREDQVALNDLHDYGAVRRGFAIISGKISRAKFASLTSR